MRDGLHAVQCTCLSGQLAARPRLHGPLPNRRHSSALIDIPPAPSFPQLLLPCRAKAAVANMEFVQFHPTSLFAPATPAVAAGNAAAARLAGGRSFLITEAVRGEGGILFNLGERSTLHLGWGSGMTREAGWAREACSSTVYGWVCDCGRVRQQ